MHSKRPIRYEQRNITKFADLDLVPMGGNKKGIMVEFDNGYRASVVEHDQETYGVLCMTQKTLEFIEVYPPGWKSYGLTTEEEVEERLRFISELPEVVSQ